MKRAIPAVVVVACVLFAFMLGRYSVQRTLTVSTASGATPTAVAAATTRASAAPTASAAASQAASAPMPSATATLAAAEPKSSPKSTAGVSKSTAKPKKTSSTGSTGTRVANANDSANDLPVVDTPHVPVAELKLLGGSPKGNALTRVVQLDEGNAVRLEFTGAIPHHQVFRAQKPRRIMIDCNETEVGGSETGPKNGAPPVQNVLVKTLANADGAVARVQVTLLEEEGQAALGKPTESIDGNALIVRW